MREGGGDHDGRGVATIISAEWIATISTCFLSLAVAILILRVQGAAWRRSLWSEAGGAVDRTAAALGGEVRPLCTGWRVEGPGRIRVEWTGGLRGVRTRVVVREGSRRRSLLHRQLADDEEVLAMVERLRGAG